MKLWQLIFTMWMAPAFGKFWSSGSIASAFQDSGGANVKDPYASGGASGVVSTWSTVAQGLVTAFGGALASRIDANATPNLPAAHIYQPPPLVSPAGSGLSAGAMVLAGVALVGVLVMMRKQRRG